MTSTKKHFTIILMLIAYLFVTLASAFLVLATGNAKIVFADSDIDTYYYNNLVLRDVKGNETEYTLAKKFYTALESINQSGAFKKGVVSYPLNNILTSSQVKAWVVDGDLDIPKAFGAARDSFLMDHPELFYIDMYKLTISAELKNGVYSAVIDTGRQTNAYRDHTFKTEQQVNDAITQFTNEVQSIVSQANANVQDADESEKDKNLAVAVNEIIASKVNYDFATLEDVEDDADGVDASAMTFSAYGALVNKKAVCSGFSMAYKAVMDALNIPCVIVSGYSKGKDTNGNDTEGDVGHSWNYVYLKTARKDSVSANYIYASKVFSNQNENTAGAWFAFDTTWNSVSTNKNKYSVMDAVTASKSRIADGKISSSNYSLKYPPLSSISYFLACNPNNSYEGTDNEFSYSMVCGTDEELSKVYVSYNGKGAVRLLADDNLRIAVRSYIITGNDGEKMWTKWQDIETSVRYSEAGHVELGVTDQVANTVLLLSSNIQYTQFAVLSELEPTEDVLSPNGDFVLYEKLNYSYENFPQENILYISDEVENATYGQYTPAPYIDNFKSTPNAGTHIIINDNMKESSSSNIMSDKSAINVKLVYDEPLHILDPSKPIEICFTVDIEQARQYTSFVKFSDGQYVHLTKDKNGVLNTLEFKFKPSMMYAHNNCGYKIDFTNVGSAKLVEKDMGNGLQMTTSDKAPNGAYYTVSRIYYACPCVFGDGRLWVECCAQPTLVDNSDLSADNFKDELGQTTFNEKERSQMMLVVNKTSQDVENAMLNEIDSTSGIDLNKEDVISSQTFDINLQICGATKQIPDGSYVKIALGFPEGYGPNDAGVTFKIFHRKHVGGNNYIIEEIPCVITQFGIVAAVTSFSPYMVVVVPADKATSKTIYASVDGKGGKLSKVDGKIKTINEGGTCEYTISADEGYALHKLLLNGKDVTSRVTADNKITLTYEELNSNNELEMQFIENGAIERFENSNYVTPVKVVLSVDDQENLFVVPEIGSMQPANAMTTFEKIVVTISIIAIAVVILGFVGAMIYSEKKTNKE